MLYKCAIIARFDPVDVTSGVELAKRQCGKEFRLCPGEDQGAAVKRQFDDRILHAAIMAIAAAAA
jgi:hypothetical protein